MRRNERFSTRVDMGNKVNTESSNIVDESREKTLILNNICKRWRDVFVRRTRRVIVVKFLVWVVISWWEEDGQEDWING